MPVGLAPATALLPVDGVLVAAGCAGLYTPTRPDLALFAMAEGSRVSAVFTSNRFCAAPIVVARRHLSAGNIRYLLVNAGNANAGMGAQGIEDALTVCESLARQGGRRPEQALPFSTGVIGEPLPVTRLCAALPALHDQLRADAWLDCAEAIMTTDTMPKGYSETFMVGAETVTVTGIAKGAGMINPDMATMLAFIATDATMQQDVLDRILRAAVAQSFNRICVDGDMSTNDACVLMASGARLRELDEAARTAASDQLADSVKRICTRLAQALVRDAEGATRFVTIRVEGATDQAECAAIADAIATSPLSKTALYAADPNWGRILAAIGRSRAPQLDMNRVSLYLNGVCFAQAGARAATYTEEQGVAALRAQDVEIRVELQRGASSGCYWTCDLSHDYVTINAAYRS